MKENDHLILEFLIFRKTKTVYIQACIVDFKKPHFNKLRMTGRLRWQEKLIRKGSRRVGFPKDIKSTTASNSSEEEQWKIAEEANMAHPNNTIYR